MGLEVTVVYSSARRETHESVVHLDSGSIVLQAVQASGLLALFPVIDLQTAALGIWGRKVGLNHTLRDHDRVEVYRPLTVDPKVARRKRFAQQGARTAGLFETKRSGAKAGY